MIGKIHNFDGRVGGQFEMSLFYPPSEQVFHGKTAEREDRFTARFVELVPSEKIVEAISFHSSDLAFSGEMTFAATLHEVEGGRTDVAITCTNTPPGIRPEDNDAGSRMSLEKLAPTMEPLILCTSCN
jgi:uncharacterized protein YndB with AHSA1/START domain